MTKGYEIVDKKPVDITIHFKGEHGNAHDIFVLVNRNTGETVDLSWENICDIMGALRGDEHQAECFEETVRKWKKAYGGGFGFDY